MKKLLSLIITIVLLSTVITGCDKTPSKKEIDDARLVAINYASIAYKAITEEEWFDDYTLIGVYIGDYNYASCKEPVKKYNSFMRIDENKKVTIDDVKESDWDFIFFFTNKENKIIACDVYILGSYTATIAETGEVITDSKRNILVSKPHIVEGSDQNWIDENYADVRQNGYKVYSEDAVCFFVEANEIR